MQNSSTNPFQSAAPQNPLDNVNLMEYPGVVCPECCHDIFKPNVMFREIPGTLVGRAGETITVPMTVFVCSKCGALSPVSQKMIDDMKSKLEKNDSGIIV